jgi:Methylase involved in ubiquinone/menaquinone biosynthesis
MNESEHIRLNEDKWDQWAPVADGKGLKYEYLRKAQAHVIELAELNQNVNFLDIGCGTGWAVGLAAKMATYKGNFYGIDISDKMIEKAKKNFIDHDNFHFIKANSESIPLENNFFDTIICTNSFHHYLHPDRAMSEISRILKSGGKIYILDPIADQWIIRFVDVFLRLFDTAHVKLYSSKEFENFMINSGLKYLGCNSINKQHKVQIGEKC